MNELKPFFNVDIDNQKLEEALKIDPKDVINVKCNGLNIEITLLSRRPDGHHQVKTFGFSNEEGTKQAYDFLKEKLTHKGDAGLGKEMTPSQAEKPIPLGI